MQMGVAFSEGPEVGMKWEGVGLCTLARRTIVTSLQSRETLNLVYGSLSYKLSPQIHPITKWNYDQVNLGNTGDYTMHMEGSEMLNIVNFFNLVFLKCF